MDPIRNGNFTSSENAALMSMGSREMTEEELAQHKKDFPKSRKKTIESWPGPAAITYIQECNWERLIGRSISNESNAKSLSWGKLCERRAFELLDTQYTLCSEITIAHHDIDCWFGSPDVKKTETTGDMKCPMTMKSFCQLVDPWYAGKRGMDYWDAVRFGWTDFSGLTRKGHPDGEKFYWQLVSNAVLTGSKYGELIVYCPYRSELQEIRELAAIFDPEREYRYKWIYFAQDDELPFLPDNGYYKNINVIRFEVSEDDKKSLTERVKMASEKLIVIP